MKFENEFILMDRIQKIQSINSEHNLETNAYLSFSGGKDSTVLNKIIDMAIPENNIPRVYINTGIEYHDVVNFVKDCQKNDNRILIVNPKENIKTVLKKNGYPFKSKEHSQKVAIFQKSGMTKTVKNYLGMGNKKDFLCPDNLKFMFQKDFELKVSDKCCKFLKKDVAKNWSIQNNKPIAITGIRQNEKGLRQSMSGCVSFSDGKIKKFHPLFPVMNDWIDWFIEKYKIELCKLYKPPFNFKRTGCKGCPFSLDLQNQLDLMAMFLPSEKKQCEIIWKKVYSVMRNINYRLNIDGGLFDD